MSRASSPSTSIFSALSADSDPRGAFDLDLLGEVDLSVADLLAQDTAIDHRHDMTAELVTSAKFAGSGRERRMTAGSSAERLSRSAAARVSA